MADPRDLPRDIPPRTHDQPPGQDLGDSIYVGNLPYDTRSEELFQLCNNYGRVLSVSIVEERESRRPRGFAFIKLSSPQEAEAAVKALAGSNFGGRPLRANIAIDGKRDQALSNGSGGGGGGGKSSRSTQPPSTRGPYGGPPRDPYSGGGYSSSSSRGPPPRNDRPYDREMDKYYYNSPPGYSVPKNSYQDRPVYDQEPHHHPYDRERGPRDSYRDPRGYPPHSSY